MNGLEIIEHIAVNQVPGSTITYMVLGGFSILIPTFIVYLFTKSDSKTLTTEFISGIVYFVLLVTLLFSGVFEKPTGEYKYKVRITEDVGYIEFTDKYDIISENDDGTYIVQEKND
jgi:hypothetical protein